MDKNFNLGVDACIAVIQKMIDSHTQKTKESYADSASGRTEVWNQGDWLGSAYEYDLFYGLVAKFKTLKRETMFQEGIK